MTTDKKNVPSADLNEFDLFKNEMQSVRKNVVHLRNMVKKSLTAKYFDKSQEEKLSMQLAEDVLEFIDD